jgi:hypothetical protein
MIRRKVCMLGAFAVGKTSLVTRFVRRMFSEDYLTTVGVRIDKREVELAHGPLTLVLWDLHGDDDFQVVRDSYMRGSAGFFLVADGTRAHTLETALALGARARETAGDVPQLLLLNKADLADGWELGESELGRLAASGVQARRASAKTGAGVEEAFLELAERIQGRAR